MIAPPGSAKSPGLHAVARPVYARQAELYETFRGAAKAAEEDTDAPAPKLQSIYSDDTTVERLAELLQDNPRGLAVIKDELSEWVLALNQYRPGGRGADRPFFCKLWSGSPVRVDRKSQKGSPLFVPRPFLGLIGGLQPDRLALLRSERGLRRRLPRPLPLRLPRAAQGPGGRLANHFRGSHQSLERCPPGAPGPGPGGRTNG